MESPVARHVAAVEGACVARHEKPPDRQAKHRRWSVPRAIDEATAYLERYLLNCWQLLRNSHLSQYFPAIVIFRLVLRGVYVLLLAPLKKCDDSMYRWECAQREKLYEHEPESSFGKLLYAVFVDRDGWASNFYADMLLEIIFMAAVCGANNASVKSRQRNKCQLRRWHWLVAAAACSGLRWVLSQRVLHAKNGLEGTGLRRSHGMHNPPAMLRTMMPVMCGVVFVFSCFQEDWWDTVPGSPWLDDPSDLFVDGGITLLGALMAFCMSMAEFELLKETSAVTVMVIGTAKDVVTVACSILIFGDVFGWENFFGMCFVLAGIAAYNYHKVLCAREEREAEEAKVRIL